MKIAGRTVVIEQDTFSGALRVMLCHDPTDPTEVSVGLDREAMWEIGSAWMLQPLDIP